MRYSLATSEQRIDKCTRSTHSARISGTKPSTGHKKPSISDRNLATSEANLAISEGPRCPARPSPANSVQDAWRNTKRPAPYRRGSYLVRPKGFEPLTF